METDRMAALGFSVLMREWRRGMAFDPWHWKPLFKTVSGHHSPSVFFLHLCYRWRNRPAPLDLIKSSQATLLEERDPDWTASTITSTVHTFLFPFTTNPESIIGDWSPRRRRKKRQGQICENIILFIEHCNEHGSQSSCSNFISNVCPNHTRALWFLQESLATVAADTEPKTISLETKFPPRSARTMKV